MRRRKAGQASRGAGRGAPHRYRAGLRRVGCPAQSRRGPGRGVAWQARPAKGRPSARGGAARRRSLHPPHPAPPTLSPPPPPRHVRVAFIGARSSAGPRCCGASSAAGLGGRLLPPTPAPPEIKLELPSLRWQDCPRGWFRTDGLWPSSPGQARLASRTGSGGGAGPGGPRSGPPERLAGGGGART